MFEIGKIYEKRLYVNRISRKIIAGPRRSLLPVARWLGEVCASDAIAEGGDSSPDNPGCWKRSAPSILLLTTRAKDATFTSRSETGSTIPDADAESMLF